MKFNSKNSFTHLQQDVDDCFNDYKKFLARLEGVHLLAKGKAAGLAGVSSRHGKGLGDGLEFADHRAFVAGDDIRFIDWPYYARMEKLLLRLFHEHSESDVMILLDSSASMVAGLGQADGREKFKSALRLTAALAFVTMGSGRCVSIQPFADALLKTPIRTGRRREKILDVMKYLVAIRPGGRTNLLDCVRSLIRQGSLNRVGAVLLISDLQDCTDNLPDALARLTGAGNQRQVIVLHTFSKAEQEPEPIGPVRLHDSETGQDVEINFTPEICEEYHKRWLEFQTGLEKSCISCGATYVPARTDLPLETLILRTLRQAGVVS